MSLQSAILVEGKPGGGAALVFDQPISFWGGVDPRTGVVTDVRHPQCGQSIAGKVIFLPGTIGSSSASAVLLELVHSGHAPAAIVMHEPDAILLLGLLVAREMGWPGPIAVRLEASVHQAFRASSVMVSREGTISRIGDQNDAEASGRDMGRAVQ